MPATAKRIETLTKDQEAMLPIWRARYLERGTATGPCDRSAIETAVAKLYESCGYKRSGKPKRTSSPPTSTPWTTRNQRGDGMTTNPAEVLELLAALEHEQWVAWSQDLASKELLTGERLDRWQRLWTTPYADLTEDEKEQDRVWARKALAALSPEVRQRVEAALVGEHRASCNPPVWCDCHPLDEAWRAAEAVLPFGWRLSVHEASNRGGAYRASAWGPKPNHASLSKEGPTPTAALQALTEKLSAEKGASE